MEVERLGRGKDFKLWPGGGRPWDWKESGTAHSPGILADDLQELVANGCRTVVLARGVFSRLKVSDEARTYLEAQGVEVIATDTNRAVQAYLYCFNKRSASAWASPKAASGVFAPVSAAWMASSKALRTRPV